ncbi:hypothetical protein RUM43_008116 [Polyplax serrata]|uniref:Uncharacterized protein n=1 Tax=Polyplax serrata TaxID=468196 RepID=A0AAN8SAB1_POLSC
MEIWLRIDCTAGCSQGRNGVCVRGVAKEGKRAGGQVGKQGRQGTQGRTDRPCAQHPVPVAKPRMAEMPPNGRAREENE